MPRVVITVPHRLLPKDAKRRVGSLIEKVHRLGGQWSEWWVNDACLAFKGRLQGQFITGDVAIEDRLVKATVVLPWTLTLFASRIKHAMEQAAREALAET